MAEPTVATFTAGDGYVCHYRRYEPTAAPRAHLVCIHGVESHGGWYTTSCGQFQEAGYRVSFLDRRGSGSNSTARGDTPGFRRLLDDLANFLKPLAANRSAIPVYLLAISWGGKLGLALQRRHPGLIDGLILVCPGLCPRVRHSFGERCAIAASRLVAPRRHFRVPIADPTFFTASPAGRQFIENDPLAVRQATARFFVESVRLDLFLRFFPPKTSAPTLLCLAGRDRIIDNQRTEQALRRLVPRGLTVVTYEDAEHTLEFEPVRDQFVADVARWIELPNK